MSTNHQSPNTLTTSLNDQIREAEHQLQNRRQFVRIRGAALGRTLYQRIADPAGLLWAGGMGFLIGEFTWRPTPQPPPGTDGSPDAGHPLFETVLNLIKLVSWGQTLYTALPGAGTPPHEPSIPLRQGHQHASA
ncbi:MAG: hypothetical protein LM522_02570 [Candidatus Contendobacter sp.]|nr:hypothetical protein [Candidatus Contendobacter sp.]